MGVAAYNRGSVRIAESIQRDYKENRGGGSKDMANRMQRAAEQVAKLEIFCREAQSLYIDITDPKTATGMLKGWMRDVWLVKHNTKRFNAMIDKCGDTHVLWVNSDHRYVFDHLQVCQAKAKAWLDVLSFLNMKGVHYPFETPAYI